MNWFGACHPASDVTPAVRRRGTGRIQSSLIFGALVVALATRAIGQEFRGGIRGAIKDAGGVVLGVDIALINEQTNIKRSTVTNERGEFAFTAVVPGTYILRAVMSGYKTFERLGL